MFVRLDMFHSSGAYEYGGQEIGYVQAGKKEAGRESWVGKIQPAGGARSFLDIYISLKVAACGKRYISFLQHNV